MSESVIIFGAGIAGLAAARYLSSRGYKVTVVESLPIPGGLARSERRTEDREIPSEYSWRGFGPWYHNTFSVMQEISMQEISIQNNNNANKKKTVYSQELSRPIDFIFTPNSPTSMMKMDTFINSLDLSNWDKVKLLYMTLKTWTASDERSEKVYAHIKAADWLNENLSEQSAKTLESIFGPWVGVDASRASVHHTARFLKRTYFQEHPHHINMKVYQKMLTLDKKLARPLFMVIKI